MVPLFAQFPLPSVPGQLFEPSNWAGEFADGDAGTTVKAATGMLDGGMMIEVGVRWMTTDWPDGNDDVLHVTTR